VEKLYGLKRAELAKQYAEEANNSIVKMAKDLLTQLTSSSSSPLSANEVLANSASQFKDLKDQISKGDYTNVDKLQEYASNYLDAARTVSKSSYDYFQVFDEVTNFLKSVQNLDSGTLSASGELPELPGIQTLVDKISSQNDDLLETTKSVGAAIVEGTASNDAIAKEQVDLLETIAVAVTTLANGGAPVVNLSSSAKTPSL
jgi:predicted RNA-binding protein with EMAP domain